VDLAGKILKGTYSAVASLYVLTNRCSLVVEENEA
jgi:hypothetical protein